MKRSMETHEEEELRRRKLEEALEVKSLRRIISAFLNYPEAAEEDIRRYESYFRKLTPSHKALLSHLPHKFQNLRWFAAQNSYFIFEMLKAFEPPLDLSEEVDISEDHYKDDKKVLGGVNRPPKSETCNEEPQIESLDENDRKCCIGSEHNGEAETALANGSRNTNYSQVLSKPHCNEHESSSAPDWLDPSLQYRVPLVDVDKVRCIIRNIVRDWAAEGQKERDECYKPILEELEQLFPHRSKESPPTCLVPGAGLGRLALEISSLGFVCQGNEFSYYMMICSNFILNNCQVAEEWTIYPWMHNNCNSLSDDDQLRPVSVPDIHPASVGITEGFSMCGGDFVEVYNDPTQTGAWDVVVTCFFIDTAHNIVEYIEIISKILKEGGVWINLGPLLYHFADTYSQENDMSIELSLEDVKRVSCQYGFEIEKESMIETTYTTNTRSMMQNRYNAAFWTMRKRPMEARKQRPTAQSVS